MRYLKSCLTLGLILVSVFFTLSTASAETISEGVAIINADDWHDDNYTGSGLKVGILDGGFKEYTKSIEIGELPNIPENQILWAPTYGNEGVVDHGTKCAEIIYDIARDAQFYLANYYTKEEIYDAIDWLISQEVNVISFSAGHELWGGGDGSGAICAKIEQARNAGILWVQAAGNEALKHWTGVYQDGDSDGWHDFNIASNDELNGIDLDPGETVYISLKWDDPWGASDNDYDLYLYDSGGTIVASSQNWQFGLQNPTEDLKFTAMATEYYGIAIRNVYSADPVNLHLYVSDDCNLEYRVEAGSLVVPADSPNALTVGAVYASTPDQTEDSSSQGPTYDSRIKPDIVAPTWVSTSKGSAQGTSAATPHVAGAALLVKQRFDYTPDQIQAYLEQHAVHLGTTPGKDNEFGSGRLHLPVEPPSLITDSAEDIGESTVSLYGWIDGLGREGDCDYRGFVWDDVSHSSDPGDCDPESTAYGSNFIETGSYVTGEYYHPVSGLTPGTDYYFRACAHNLSGWSYGEELQFHTAETIEPTVTNHTGAQIITGDSAYLWGEITDSGGEDPNVTVYWGDNDGVTTPLNWDNAVVLGYKPSGKFYTFVEGLVKDTPYYYRCYATNSAGNDWADSTETFTIITIRPTVTNTGGVDPVTATTATLHGELVDSGGEGSASVNIYWGDDDAESGPWDHCEYLGTILDGAFSAQINGLAPNKQYFYRCYALIPGEGYDWADSSIMFTTEVKIPVADSGAADPVEDSVAGLHGNITDTGGENCDIRGFVWGLSSLAEPGSNTAPGDSGYDNQWTETGSFSSVPFSHWAAQLNQGTRHYFRSCAHNSAGWDYGPELGFTTKPGTPTGFDTVAVSTAQINLSWTAGGGAEKTMVRWSETTYPTAPNEGYQAYFGTSSNYSHTGLNPGSHYYYSAWSWVEGSDVWSESHASADATTQAAATAPTVTTSPATNTTKDSSMLHGDLTGLGTAPTVQVSFEYRKTSESTWDQTTPEPMTSTGSFEFSPDSLLPDTEYLYRARADGDGIGYGNTYSFSTLALNTPTVINNGASDITSNGAILHATLSGLGTAPTVQVSFEYRKTSESTWQGTTPEPMTSTGTFDYALSGLAPATTYDFRAMAVGDGTALSGQQGFTTGTTPPVVTTNTPANVASYSASLKGNLVSLGTSTLVDMCFEWRKQGDTSYTETYPRQLMSVPGEFTFHLSGLAAETTYEFRAKAIGNGTGVGLVETFTTDSESSFLSVGPAEWDDFASIQEGIDNAADYATIWVSAKGPSDPYLENVVVNKPVTILAPDGPAGTFVSGDPDSRDYVFEVTADNVTIDGFTVKNGSIGIYLNGVTGCTISRNVFTGNYDGMQLEGSSNNRIEGNNLTGVDWGLYLSDSSHSNIISGNTMHDALSGAKLESSNDNRLERNTITGNTDYGIYELQSTGTEIIGNDIYDNATTGDPYYGGIVLDYGAIGTVIHYNNIYGNSASHEYHYGAFALNPAVGEIDARYNYWGHASGPRHETASWRPDPGGDKVDANVVFQPWLIAEYDPANPPDIITDLHIVSDSVLPAAIEDETYMEVLQASGGTGSYGWALYSGTLPDVLDLNSNTGEISGTPTAEGKYQFAVQVNDGVQGTYQDFRFIIATQTGPELTAPTVTTSPATGTTTNSASLHGDLTDLGTASTVQVSFEYKESSETTWKETTQEPKSSTGTFGYTLSVLAPGMTYDFRAKAVGDNTGYGGQHSFTTVTAPPGTAGFTNVTQTSIRANWTANGNPAGTEYYCENTTKGTNSGWTTNTYWDSTGLACGTTYSFRVYSKNGNGVQAGPTSLGSQMTSECETPASEIYCTSFDEQGDWVDDAKIYVDEANSRLYWYTDSSYHSAYDNISEVTKAGDVIEFEYRYIDHYDGSTLQNILFGFTDSMPTENVLPANFIGGLGQNYWYDFQTHILIYKNNTCLFNWGENDHPSGTPAVYKAKIEILDTGTYAVTVWKDGNAVYTRTERSGNLTGMRFPLCAAWNAKTQSLSMGGWYKGYLDYICWTGPGRKGIPPGILNLLLGD